MNYIKMVLSTFTFFLMFLSSIFGQMVNNGGTISVLSGTTLYSKTSIQNTNTGTISNAGTIITLENIENESGSIINGDGDYTIGIDWTNEGTFTAGASTVEFDGATTSNLTTGGEAFYNVDINKNNGTDVWLVDNMEVTNVLDFASNNNKVQIGNNDLTFGTSATITNYDNNDYLVTDGWGIVYKEDLASFTYPVGFDGSTYNPVSLTESGTTDKIGVRCLENILENGTSGAVMASGVVDVSWGFIESTAGGSNIAATVQWNASDELTDFDRDDCGLSDYSGSWNISTGATYSGTDPYTMTRSAITQLGAFAVMTFNPLPVELLFFKGKLLNKKSILLEWETAIEINNKGFDIQKSADGINFGSSIGFVEGHGTSHTSNTYTFLDNNPFQGGNYYRLKQVDYDGKITFSKTIVVQYEKEDIQVNIFPNPASEKVNISIRNPFRKNLKVQLYDSIGRVVWENVAVGNTARWEKSLDFLSAGAYFLSVQNGQQSINKKIIVITKN